MAGGWIKVHRSLQEKGWYKKPEAVALWIHLLMEASHNEKEVFWNGRTTILKPGQFITGRKSLSEKTGIAQTTIERWLNVFESGQQIGQQKTSTSRLISITNWKQYQERGQMSGQQTDSGRTADGQRTDTIKEEYKEYKEGEDDEEKPKTAFVIPIEGRINSRSCQEEKKRLLSDQIFIEAVCMKFSINPDDVTWLLDQFIIDQSMSAKFWTDFTDFHKHVNNWLNKTARDRMKNKPTNQPQKARKILRY